MFCPPPILHGLQFIHTHTHTNAHARTRTPLRAGWVPPGIAPSPAAPLTAPPELPHRPSPSRDQREPAAAAASAAAQCAGMWLCAWLAQAFLKCWKTATRVCRKGKAPAAGGSAPTFVQSGNKKRCPLDAHQQSYAR
eukprot:1138957-Pelagomonas_calceolata.AAC.10